MRITDTPRIDDDALVVHVHIPRTGGTSLRLLLEEAFGIRQCLMNYQDEVLDKSAEDLAGIRCVSGHIPYGVHEHFLRVPAYITVVRNPIDRYISTYAAFLRNPAHRHHAAATQCDINDFVHRILDSKDPSLRNQLGNLQCRLVCGEPDFQRARSYVDERYFLAAPYPEVDQAAKMVLAAIEREDLVLPSVHVRERQSAADDNRLQLTRRTIDTLMESEREDVLLFSHTQKAFAKLRETLAPIVRRQARSPLPTQRQEVLPPKDLRFMGETDELFIRQADYLSEHVLSLAGTFGSGEPKHLLDIGCGYGRLAYGLRRRGFKGSYVGFDILSRHISWLNGNFLAGPDDDQYRFDYLNLYNERYNPAGEKRTELPISYAEGSFDCLVSLSVFTHFYEEEVVRYVRQLSTSLEDRGLWITTFFCVPPNFDLHDQPTDSNFRLTRQVSDHGYICDPDEPLYVIAFKEEFILRLLAQEGLEVVSQRKGRWLTATDSLELQDWFVLRKRSTWATSPYSPSNKAEKCNICGSGSFGLGPNGRRAVNGNLPRCLGCEALERHRIVRRIFQSVPQEFLSTRKALQFSRDPGLDPRWFKSFEVSIFDGENSLDIQSIDRRDESYDFISLSHVLESVPDDISGFNELCRILSPQGLMHVSFGSPLSRDKTADLDSPIHEWKAHHLYGRDLASRFKCKEKGLTTLEVKATDPSTGTREVVHLFMRNPDLARQLCQWLSQDGDIAISTGTRRQS